jgi:hypothetical protein
MSEESRTDKKLRVPDPLGLSSEELDRFVSWLSRHRSYPGSADVVRLHRDKVKQRRQGHVKQSFAGVFRFLGENPRFISELASAPTDEAGLVSPSPSLIRAWTRHLNAHASDVGETYSYQTLRRLLQPNMGGQLQGSGGGASGTLKRMFPLVARYAADLAARSRFGVLRA